MRVGSIVPQDRGEGRKGNIYRVSDSALGCPGGRIWVLTVLAVEGYGVHGS